MVLKGLDFQIEKGEIFALLGVNGAGKTIVLANHDMAEVETLCDRIAILNNGNIAFCGTASIFLSCAFHIHHCVAEYWKYTGVSCKKSGKADNGSAACVFTIDYAFGDYVPCRPAARLSKNHRAYFSRFLGIPIDVRQWLLP